MKGKSIIALIGLPCVGKSHFGRLLASELNRQFVDIDELILSEYRSADQQNPALADITAAELIKSIGETEFSNIEERRIMSLTPGANSIIATGGSVIYSDPAIEKLNSLATIIYLKDSAANILARIGDPNEHGIVGLSSRTDFYRLADEREPLYAAAANHKLSLEGKSEKQVVAELTNIIQEVHVHAT